MIAYGLTAGVRDWDGQRRTATITDSYWGSRPASFLLKFLYSSTAGVRDRDGRRQTATISTPLPTCTEALDLLSLRSTTTSHQHQARTNRASRVELQTSLTEIKGKDMFFFKLNGAYIHWFLLIWSINNASLRLQDSNSACCKVRTFFPLDPLDGVVQPPLTNNNSARGFNVALVFCGFVMCLASITLYLFYRFLLYFQYYYSISNCMWIRIV